MNLWAEAFDDMQALDRSTDLDVEQRLKLAEIKALLAIGQELSIMQDQGINPAWSPRVIGAFEPTVRR